MRMLFQASSHEDLLRIIRSVRHRWRLRLLLRGLAIVVGVGVALFVLSSFGMDRLRFSSTAVTVFRVLTYGTLAALAIQFLVRPFFHSVSDEQVALYLEEHEPSLKGQVVTGVQFGRAADQPASAIHSPAILRKLVRTAIERCVAVEEGRRVERQNLLRSSGILAGATLTGLMFFVLNPAFLRHGAPFLLTPWNVRAAASPYSIDVEPGDITISRGADLRVAATLENFDAERVDLAVKREAEGTWERWPMTVDDETGDHLFLLFELNDKTEYFVEASGVRSPIFTVTVADLPYVDRIDLIYNFPAYTGLSPQRVENTGDIAAIAGTRVSFEITPTMQVAGGVVVIDERDSIALELDSAGVLRGMLRVQEVGIYRVMLESLQGQAVIGSPDYLIDVLRDQPPSISFSKPGRDIQVTAVEEVFTEITAEDDYGIGKVELVYSINGGPEQTIALFDGAARKAITAGHTFYLEEHELEPGDFLSYYARATERERGEGTQQAVTDIYFQEVRRLDREYRQAEAAGGGGGGAGMSGELSRWQRQIIAATFKIVRDEDEFTDKARRENLATLALAQGRLRQDVETLVSRISSRGIVELDTAFNVIAEALPLAVEAMKEAEEHLGERKPKDALSPEQRALQQLQRAEAAYRETQITRGQGGGGGGNASTPDELADLFELELDKMRNQYEQVERGQQQAMDEALDETLQKLQELARRQQQQNERARARMQGQGGGSADAQRRLAEEAEELARQLERLSREQSRPDLQETARRLQEAADAMRRAAANARSDGVAQGVNALDELREARRLLDKNRSARLERDAQDALRRVERLAQQQREMISDVDDLSGDANTRGQQLRRMVERKEQMAEEVADIESQLDQMARESIRDQRDASRSFQDAANSIRDNKLKEKIWYSRGVVQQRSGEYARNFEEQIEENIGELRDRVAEGMENIGESREQRLGRSLEQTRDAVRGLESLQGRMRDQQRQGAQQGQEQQGQQQGEQQQAEGQQSESGQQGEQGQQNQQGQQGQQGQRGGQEGQGQDQQRQGQRGQVAPGGGGGFPPNAARQFGRELQERRNELRELRDGLRREGVDVTDLDAVLDRLQSVMRRPIGDPRGMDQLAGEVIQGLKEFEYALRRQLQIGTEAERLILSGSDDVPEGYRELVEEYYKSLSNKK